MSSYLIKPREPTVLSHKGYHELSSVNLLVSVVVPTAHILGILNIERFNVTLGEALSSFPLPAGRLVGPDTPDAPWKIRLINSGIPVSVIDNDADETFPTDLTVQSTPPYVVPLNVAGIVNTEGESDEPLFRLTITRFAKLNSTSIGTFRSHVLCAFSLDPLGSSRHTDENDPYQGLGPIDPPLYYEPEAIKFQEIPKTPSPLSNRFDSTAPPPWKQPERNGVEFVAFRLTTVQLTEIHNSVTKGMEHSRMTRMDAVTGSLARCLSEVEPESKPIDTISYVANHRGTGICPLNAAVNACVYLSTGLQLSNGVDPHDDVLTCATEIRKSLEKLKDPRLIEDMVADLAKV